MIAAFGHLISALHDPAALPVFLTLYGYPLVYLGTTFFGELAIVSAFVLVGQGVLGFFPVFIFCLLGTITADAFWYLVGRASLLFFKREEDLFFKSAFARALRTLTRQHLVLVLLGSKFFIGGRLLIFLFVARARAKWWIVFSFDLLSAILFIAVLAALSWSGGVGISLFFKNHAGVATLVMTCILVGLLIFGEHVLKRRFTDSNKVIDSNGYDTPEQS